MNKYSSFISQIPDEVMQNTQMHLGSNIALFKSKAYITRVTLNTNDYHMMLPSEKPPDLCINDKLISIDKREILAINPGDAAFCTKAIPTKPFFSFLIKAELLQRVAEEMDFCGEIRFLKSQNLFSSDLIQTMRNFEKEASRPDSLILILDCLETQIAALLLREFKTNLKSYSLHSPDMDTYIDTAIEYIRTFFSANITIDDICGEINVSPFHFIRTFKQKIGVTPHQYLLNIRIEKAKELLCMRQHSVAETAMLCGFLSLPHFSSTFKTATGYSPSEYKKVFLK